jgi:NAD(P)-dependent dehydrogenase (short-subunit alcohol dehydrogenase family)
VSNYKNGEKEENGRQVMNTKVCVVTRAASGLGKAVALELAKSGAMVILIPRDPERGARVQREISNATDNPNVELELGDLSNLSSVRNLAVILLNQHEKIDVLINNPAVYRKQRRVTVDGYEEMFAANHLGPYLLTRHLIDSLRASSSGRIIMVTAPSATQLDFDDLQGERQFNPLKAYGASKMANLLFTFQLADRLQDTNIRVNAVNPGLVRSSLLEEIPVPLRYPAWLVASRPEQAAREIVRLAAEPEFENTHGKFFRKGEEVEPPAYALDSEVQQRLWEISETLTDADEPAANYDPTGSAAMHNDKEVPAEMIRPKDVPPRQ